MTLHAFSELLVLTYRYSARVARDLRRQSQWSQQLTQRNSQKSYTQSFHIFTLSIFVYSPLPIFWSWAMYLTFLHRTGSESAFWYSSNTLNPHTLHVHLLWSPHQLNLRNGSSLTFQDHCCLVHHTPSASQNWPKCIVTSWWPLPSDYLQTKLPKQLKRALNRYQKPSDCTSHNMLKTDNTMAHKAHKDLSAEVPLTWAPRSSSLFIRFFPPVLISLRVVSSQGFLSSEWGLANTGSRWAGWKVKPCKCVQVWSANTSPEKICKPGETQRQVSEISFEKHFKWNAFCPFPGLSWIQVSVISPNLISSQ